MAFYRPKFQKVDVLTLWKDSPSQNEEYHFNYLFKALETHINSNYELKKKLTFSCWIFQYRSNTALYGIFPLLV